MTFDEWLKDNEKFLEPIDMKAWLDTAWEAATKAEREECAKVCEGLYSKDYWEDGKAFATAIRNRSNES